MPVKPYALLSRANLDVSRDLAETITAVHPRGRRSLGDFAQAILLLRFMRQRAGVADLARDTPSV